MDNFDFYSPTRILFGKGTENTVGQQIKPYAQKVLLHYGSGSIIRTGLYDRVVKSLRENQIDFVELGGVQPNPRLSLVREGIRLCREQNVDLVLAVGGGSVIDSAKAIALGVFWEGDLWSVWENAPVIQKALPIATILTIPAAGSESSPSVVITNEEKKLKIGFQSPLLRPVFSIMNPELFMTLPKSQLAYGVCDMMSHIFERYFTQTLHTDLTDGLCEATLRTIMKNGPIALQNMQDYDAWAEIGFAGNVAHNGLLGMGRSQDWGCHKLEHELSAVYDIPHGAGLAILTPAWMKYVYQENIGIFVQFAVNVMGVDGSFRDPQALVLEGIERLSAFFDKMGLPKSLREAGIDENRLEEMAKAVTKYSSGNERPVGVFKKLYWQDVLAIYRMAY